VAVSEVKDVSVGSAREREQAYLLKVYAQLPIEPVSARDVHLTTADGRRILDLYGGHAVAALGYAHPRIVETLRSQAEILTFQSNAVPLDVRARAAERLVSIAPKGLDKVFFANTGAEVNENALRLAFLATGRKRVIALEHGFHGRTAAASAVTWGAKESWYAFPRTPFPVTFAPRDDSDRAAELIDDETAAVIVEPIQGIAGAFDLDPSYLARLRRRCDETGTLLIFDEVQCGMGRSGHYFVAQKVEVVPDIITTAKALGAGFPVAALMTHDRVASKVKSGSLGTTFGGGPLACALVETVIDTIERDGLLENVENVSAIIRRKCRTGPVSDIQGGGFLIGLRCDTPAVEVRDKLLARNILVGTSSDPHVVRLMPPLTLREEHALELAAALEDL
jgi:acetylornithine/succinyldiaminopimelate/putrescine aminotransferase